MSSFPSKPSKPGVGSGDMAPDRSQQLTQFQGRVRSTESWQRSGLCWVCLLHACHVTLRWVILPAKEFAYYHHHVHERRVFLGFSVAMNCRTYKRVPEPSTSYRAKPLVWGTHAGIFRLSMADTSKRTGSGAGAVVETSSSYLGLAWDV